MEEAERTGRRQTLGVRWSCKAAGCAADAARVLLGRLIVLPRKRVPLEASGICWIQQRKQRAVTA